MYRPLNLGQSTPAPGSREELLRAFIRQAQRYHFASMQDANLIVAARHNAYASGIIGTVVEQTDEAEVQALLGISLRELKSEIYAVQDKLEAQAFKLLEKVGGG